MLKPQVQTQQDHSIGCGWVFLKGCDWLWEARTLNLTKSHLVTCLTKLMDLFSWRSILRCSQTWSSQVCWILLIFSPGTMVSFVVTLGIIYKILCKPGSEPLTLTMNSWAHKWWWELTSCKPNMRLSTLWAGSWFPWSEIESVQPRASSDFSLLGSAPCLQWFMEPPWRWIYSTTIRSVATCINGITGVW